MPDAQASGILHVVEPLLVGQLGKGKKTERRALLLMGSYVKGSELHVPVWIPLKPVIRKGTILKIEGSAMVLEVIDTITNKLNMFDPISLRIREDL